MKLASHYLLTLGLLSLSAYAHASVTLKVEGIPKGALLDNVNIYLDQLKNEVADGSERHQYVVQQAVDKGLRALGYYNTQYHFSQSGDVLTLQVQLDQPVKINETDISLTGQASQDSEFEKVLKEVPKKGTVLNHETYDNFKGEIETLAQKRGYFDGTWLYNRLEVYPKEHIADWRLAYDSGTRYKYGKIAFKGSQIREDYLRNILRIHTDEDYLMNDLSKITSDYSSSKWFSSVLVEPHLNEQDKIVDLDLLFVPQKRNLVEVGIGFATDDGPRLQLNWKKPWLNNRGHNIESATYISKPEQRFEFAYNIPIKEQPLNYYYQFSGSLEREDRNDTKYTGISAAAQRFWTHETGWSFSGGLKARYDAFQQGNQEKQKTLLVYPTASLNRTRTDGNRYPLWGDSQKLTVDYGTKLVGSDVDFYRIKASSAWVRTLAQNHRFYLRAEVGYLNSKNFDRITPALRYFAGGDMSVRGFGYRDISPRGSDGKLTGGSHLMTSAAEYQYQVYPNWWAAAFYDTGLSARDFKGANLHSGAGLGVRWASPIGAIKLDIATPVRSPNNEKGIQFYIGLGSDL
ncbi:hypothetical protein A4G20_07285 [Pasteurellaceae bacterium RH1A]|nr:hypothetical protein A4G20_07285 [Pasteurellaceae bacterium RH1A]